MDIQLVRTGENEELCVVAIGKVDSRSMKLKFANQMVALSFVSLVDGYFRHIVDAHHYFCKEVAPPRLQQLNHIHCHGPIQADFAVQKLKRPESEDGHYVLRCGTLEMDKYFITVRAREDDFKHCLITNVGGEYMLLGGMKTFLSLEELVNHYSNETLRSDGVLFRFAKCCPPRHRERSNLIIVRSNDESEIPSSPMLHRAVNRMVLHTIRSENLVQEEHIGHGTMTDLYAGKHIEVSSNGEERQVEVVLKILDSNHRNLSEFFLEAAGMMSQLNHKHLVHLHGMSMRGENHIMVLEKVKFGSLDIYIQRHHALEIQWIMQVAQQLACAMIYLEDKGMVHGNVCAKNVLLVREGVETAQPFIKLGDPGIRTTAFNRDDRLERIPWIAPECIENPKRLGLPADKWNFGVALWEMFNRGEPPLRNLDRQNKHEFYLTRKFLPMKPWRELEELVEQCMTYEPLHRPCFRAILRDLNSLHPSGYVVLPFPPGPDVKPGTEIDPEPAVYEERFLKFVSILGTGNFGTVELCRYDLLGDNTGELVAVKKLQHEHSNTEFEKEIDILKSLPHENIVRYMGICRSTGGSVKLVMEFLPFGSLRDYLQKSKDEFNTKRLLLFSWQIAKAMEFLGSKRFVHRDLAARNILVESHTKVKIGDFGLSRQLPLDHEYYRPKQPGESPIYWYAPESLCENKFSTASDGWSFGVVLYELFTFCEKEHGPPQVFMRMMGGSRQGQMIVVLLIDLLKRDERLPQPKNCPVEVYSMMRDCWAFADTKRPTFQQLIDRIDCLRESARC
uniref:tyrosine-protein kinase JAK2 n=1 Tax=Myxine glutinosa TaxID=7769 RepID=UPI00358F9C03